MVPERCFRRCRGRKCCQKDLLEDVEKESGARRCLNMAIEDRDERKHYI